LRGGGGPGFDYTDVSNGKGAQTATFDASAPDYRIATGGFNNEGECKNKACEAYGNQVII
jgi:hypothetical protein